MSAGWLASLAIATLLAALFVRGVIRGAVRHARDQIRRDLVALEPPRPHTGSMAQALGSPVATLAPPAHSARESVVGWLWWSATVRHDGTVIHDHGWAWTYRRARRAAGLPLDLKNAGIETLYRSDVADR